MGVSATGLGYVLANKMNQDPVKLFFEGYGREVAKTITRQRQRSCSSTEP